MRHCSRHFILCSKLSVETLYYPWINEVGRHPTHYDGQKSYREVELERLTIVWEETRENLQRSNEIMKKCFDRKAKTPDFRIGERVLLKKFSHPAGTAQKFANFWEGVHTIIGLPDSHHALIVRNGLPREAARKVHLDQIKTFKERAQEIEPIFPIRSAEVDTVSEPLNESLSNDESDPQPDQGPICPEPSSEGPNVTEPFSRGGSQENSVWPPSRPRESPSTSSELPVDTQRSFVE